MTQVYSSLVSENITLSLPMLGKHRGDPQHAQRACLQHLSKACKDHGSGKSGWATAEPSCPSPLKLPGCSSSQPCQTPQTRIRQTDASQPVECPAIAVREQPGAILAFTHASADAASSHALQKMPFPTRIPYLPCDQIVIFPPINVRASRLFAHKM